MKVKFYTFVESAGDGSVFVRYFKSREAAENYAKHGDERFCDDIVCKELEFNNDGELVTDEPVHWSEHGVV